VSKHDVKAWFGRRRTSRWSCWAGKTCSGLEKRGGPKVVMQDQDGHLMCLLMMYDERLLHCHDYNGVSIALQRSFV